MPKKKFFTKLQELKEQFYKKDIFNNHLNIRGKVIFVCFLIFICFAAYLWQINSVATRGYKIRELEEKTSQLKEINKKLEVEVTELRSTARITEKVKELNMVEVVRVEYLKSNGDTVAVNR